MNERSIGKAMTRIGLALFLMGFTAMTPEVEVGQPAPDFELEDPSGKSYRLSDFQGEKHVVLEFFRSGSW